MYKVNGMKARKNSKRRDCKTVLQTVTTRTVCTLDKCD